MPAYEKIAYMLICLYAIFFTVFEVDLQIYWLPVLLFFTITCIIMFLFLLTLIFEYNIAHCQGCILHVPGLLPVFPV